MIIYTIKYGDSLFSIANKYQVSIEQIRRANGFDETNLSLVPGQALILPTNVYIVQPGDSLYKIAAVSYVPIQAIKDANRLTSDALSIGRRLILPPRPKYMEQGLSFILPSTQERTESLIRYFSPNNTYFGIFEYHINEDGTLSELTNDDVAVRASRENHVAPLATITNLTPGGFSPELTKTVLSSPDMQN
ncbi:LysM peptidoglycan-binding domain-containing protein [Paenibacillus sp. R14(2021)]|uniref:LysM peptidoglycan-binding domain-containing protein n=1 Tax=Paenibacillus sp. R14(2021) TaxID=2859228 RepID=UPI0021574891|nr:LysM peptidoglycan-binding domain-containing protein [Paenibacillus sp. R14(2021)]